ncbi:DUF4873 domain-containing protein [Mycolicibacterium sp. XJ1819]
MTSVYDGPAQMRVDDRDHTVRVRLTGHFDPIDGRYHWRGMVFDWTPQGPVRFPQQVDVRIGERSASAQLVEVTPWGTHSVAGVGAPPYPG